jgi:hypothetical protein
MAVSGSGVASAAVVFGGDAEGDGLGEGCDKTGPWGTLSCGRTVEFMGSYGLLVKHRAMNVANAAAAITLIATRPSPVLGAG